MVPVSATQAWRDAHPHALVGVLELSHLDNTVVCPALEQRKRALEARLRQRYSGFTRPDFISAPVLREYVRYYKGYEKTYHVQLQLESTVLKGKPLPSVSPLVDANFMAEIETLVVTAAHDVAKLVPPLCVDISRAGDCMTQMNGSTRPLRLGDMLMRDAAGIACSILYGQDSRSPITPRTTHALLVSYAPAGVHEVAVRGQLDAILDNVHVFAPHCVVEQQTILS